MKKILFIALMAGFAMTAAAQISEGEPSAKTYTTGNRPEKGTFGLYFGVESDLFGGNLDDAGGFLTKPFPIVNLKYMLTDNLELRLGMRFRKDRASLNFGNDEDADNGIAYDESYKFKAVVSDNQFRPGIAYHFTKSNLLDVYAGAEGLIGWRRNFLKQWSEVDGNETSTTMTNQLFNRDNTTKGVQFGVGAFIGLQAFIARLPLAIGFEYGITTLWDGGMKNRSYVKNGDNDPVITYSEAANWDPNNWIQGASAAVGAQRGAQFDYMKARRGQWGNQVRFTISYYFNR